MAVSWQIPRNCLAWIVLSQLALIIPHGQRLPWWVLAVYAVCAVWRVMVYQGRWSMPTKMIKVCLSLLCVFGIYQRYSTFIGLEPTVALLFSGFCLKLLETHSPRDVYTIIFLAYFVAITEFLFAQDFTIAAFVLFTILLITTALVALHQHSYDRFSVASVKKSAVIFTQAVPLMIILFLVFPRFEPFWKVPLPSHQAKTGISDTLTPGDISNLSKSSELAFRVLFDGAVPEKSDLYWRGLVLSRFDGRTWYQGEWKQEFLLENEIDSLLKKIKKPINYSIIQEPSHQPWLFSLALAYSFDKDIRVASDFRLFREEPIHSRFKYTVRSDQRAEIEREIGRRTRTFETFIPEGSNPLAKYFAQNVYTISLSARDYVHRILKHYTDNNFVYTLKPPALGEHTVDEFLFTTQRGFCSHYASSFVFLMRAVGVPARVVVGYQGGEINPITGTVLVHQFDAHSWAEVWLEGQGWVRFDPTGAVSPQRIELGLEEALADEGSFLIENLLSPMRYRNVAWLNTLRLQIDAMSYYWTSWVLQYKGKKQVDVLQALLGELTEWRLATFILGFFASILLLVMLFALKNSTQNKTSAEGRLYLYLCRQLEKAGYSRANDEGPMGFAQRIAETNTPWGACFLEATNAFLALRYESISNEKKSQQKRRLRIAAMKLNYHLLRDR